MNEFLNFVSDFFEQHNKPLSELEKQIVIFNISLGLSKFQIIQMIESKRYSKKIEDYLKTKGIDLNSVSNKDLNKIYTLINQKKQKEPKEVIEPVIKKSIF